MSIDTRTPSERDADNARVNQAVAEDVAVDMAAKATVEHARANNLAVDAAVEHGRANNFAADAAVEAARADALGTVAVRQAVRADGAQNERDAALETAQRASRDARNSSMAFYLLLGTVGIASLIGLLWYFGRPSPEATTATNPPVNRQVAPAPTTPRTVTAPAVAAPAPAAPIIIERQVAVPVDRPVAVPVPVDRPVAVPVPVDRPVAVPVPTGGDTPVSSEPVTTPPGPAPAPATGDKPLRGYVEPASGGGQ